MTSRSQPFFEINFDLLDIWKGTLEGVVLLCENPFID